VFVMDRVTLSAQRTNDPTKTRLISMFFPAPGISKSMIEYGVTAKSSLGKPEAGFTDRPGDIYNILQRYIRYTFRDLRYTMGNTSI